jgi:hypothetical protein
MFTDAKDPEYHRNQFCLKNCAYKNTCETACLIASEQRINIIVDLDKNYWDDADHNEYMREEFYKAKEIVFNMGYDEYVEERSLPLNPMHHHIFTPLATYRVKDAKGNINRINIYARALGGMLITDEM